MTAQRFVYCWHLLFLSLTLTLHPTRAAAADVCPAQLPAAIDAILDRPAFARSRWGALIQILESRSAQKPQTLYDRDSRRYFIPASNTKILTTAAALQNLGAQFRIRTSVYGVRSQTGWKLRVVGRGDPTLTNAQLKALAQQLSRRGIQQVEQLIVDDSYYQGEAINPDWTVGDAQAGYGAPVNSLILNENLIGLSLVPQAIGQPLRVKWDDPTEAAGWQIENNSLTVAADAPEFLEVGRAANQLILKVSGQLRVGAASEPVAVAIDHPAQNFLQHFRQALASEKITVRQAVIVNRPSAIVGSEVAFIESPPLAALLQEANQESNNLYAETLLRSLGATRQTAANPTLKAGLTTLVSTLTMLGIDASSFALVDGSGLARLNSTSPESLVQTLRSMAAHPAAAVYQASLPVAGVSGTLKNRFQGTSAQGVVQAKTGTMTGVSALSGYVKTPNFAPIVFSLIVNQSQASTTVQRDAIDEVVVMLTRLRSCK